MDTSFEPVILPGRASQLLARRRPPPVVQEDIKPFKLGCDYAREYLDKEEELYKLKARLDKGGSTQKGDGPGSLSEVDTMTNMTSLGMSINEVSVYEKYSFTERKNNLSQTLPIFEHRDDILNAIEAQRIVIVKGSTGCGKTTQVPQFILDSAKEKNVPCNIVVTQPRRLAAITIAKRVCAERECSLGTLVGYQVGQDRKANDDTRILYCTTGVLLQKLIAKKDMREYTHVILDEIHERDQDMDFLLIVVRRLLNTNSKNVKLIVMSATVETGTFSEYLYTIYNDRKYHPMVVELTKEENYPVIKYFLGDIMRKIPEAQSIPVKPDKPEITKKSFMTAVRLIQAFDYIDEQEKKIRGKSHSKGSVLVFLPGLHEIEEMHGHLDMNKQTEFENVSTTYSWWIKPLHSSITSEEQDEVLKSPPQSDQRKIILSTNIAESSLTVPDVKYVIDFCLTKMLVTDESTNFTSLELEWASKNSLMQRAGRVGRVGEGRVYRMIHKEFYKNHLEQESTPEMLRCPLERLVLQAKLLDMGSPKEILALAMNQPDLGNIRQAVWLLKEIGALLVTVDGVVDEFDGDLTQMGRIIAALPMDVRLGKLIFLGSVFNVLDDCIVMACAMSTKNVFSSPFQKYLEAYNSKLSWADATCSDCYAFVNAYKLWRKRCVEGAFKKRAFESRWAREEFLQLRVLKEIATVEHDVKLRLQHKQFYSIEKRRGTPRSAQEDTSMSVEKALFLKLAIAGAFYPNYFMRGAQGGQVDEKEATNTLGGNDPYSTVYLQGMPSNQPSVLYTKSIRAQFETISSRVNVMFDNGSKVFVRFGRLNAAPSKMELAGRRMDIPGKIDMAVYRAVKMRQTKPDIRIPVLNPIEAAKRYKKYLEDCEKRKKANSELIREFEEQLSELEWPWRKDGECHSGLLNVFVTWVETPYQFWIQSPGGCAQDMLIDMMRVLNTDGNVIQAKPNENLKRGGVYAFLDAGPGGNPCFYRCRIVSKQEYRDEDQDTFRYDVFFMDYGNTRRDVPSDKIYHIDSKLRSRNYMFDKLPDLAVECSLAKVQPSVNDEGKWSSEAIRLMRTYCLTKRTIAKVYSTVDDVVVLKLLDPRRQTEPYHRNLTLNCILIEKGLAEKSEESYVSLLSRVQRKRLLERKEQSEDVRVNLNPSRVLSLNVVPEEIDPPDRQECSQEVILKGPYSPLEMKVYGVTKSSMAKDVKIERNSVNSVLLDTNPSDSHERMLVAAGVGTNPSRDKLSLRHTTVMPNVAGLPALLCMMFAPMVELRTNANYTMLTGALCGLGYNKSDCAALFGENDIEVVFDVDINLEVIEVLNKIRHWLNIATCSQSTAPLVTECRNKLREYIRRLLKKQYQLQQLNYPHNSYCWGLIPKEKLLNPIKEPKADSHPADKWSDAYPLIWGISLNGDATDTEKNLVAKNIAQLRDFASGNSKLKNEECILCRITLENCTSAQLHLKSAQHKAREKRYHVKMDDSRSEVSSSVTGPGP